MPQYQKPENGLRRANELLEVGKKQDALDVLHEVIKARKFRTWTKVHEQIMSKHLELCVELRKPHLAKDGLFQYRNLCQQVNVKSLEDVVTGFLEQAERRAEQARQASQGLVEEVAEDLDQAEESPEKLLLSAVSGEGAQDRADRAVLSPWLRFLWESYRQCLELLRNNVQVEQLYHKVAKQAFQFCLKYQRRAEFRKLCDNLRTHVNQLQKQHPTHYSVKLSNPDTLALHQETRLTQLDVAIQMELWQEAYKSAEDVHQLMQSSKKAAKPQTLATYYERLAVIFWKAGNALYHTAALFKLFQLNKDLKKSFTTKEATHLATRVLLATLSIRWSDQVHDLARHLEMEEAHSEHQRRLAGLLSWPTPPTRQLLLKELLRVNVTGLASEPAQRLYQWLESEFSPLKLSSEIEKSLDAIKELGEKDYTQYIDALQQVAALKILKQISQVYRSISLKRLLAIVPFFDISRLERLIVAAGKKAQIQVRIDHRIGSVEFGVGEALTFGSDDNDLVGGGLASSQLDVPVIQSMPSEHIRQYLQQMYIVLREAVDSVDHQAVKIVMDKLKVNAKTYEAKKNEHQMLERKKKIEAYKEKMERVRTEVEEQTKLQEKKELERRQREDQIRLEQEQRDRSAALRRREQEDLKRKMMEDRIDKMNPNLRPAFKNLTEEDIQNLDTDTLLQKQITHMEQEKREQAAKLKQQEKKWDYYIRAIHQEEIPLREQEYKERSIEDRRMWEEHETERVQKDEEDHILKVENHKRLSRMEEDARAYLQIIRETRAAEMKRRMEDWKNRMEIERQRRLDERKEERKQKRRNEWLQQKEEAERQKREEEERKKRESDDPQTRRNIGEDGDRRRRYPDRKIPTREQQEEGQEPKGSEAETWERRGPIPGSTAQAAAPVPSMPPQPQQQQQQQQQTWERRGPIIGSAAPAPVTSMPPQQQQQQQQTWERKGPISGQAVPAPINSMPPHQQQQAWERKGPISGPADPVPVTSTPPQQQQQQHQTWERKGPIPGPPAAGAPMPPQQQRTEPTSRYRPPMQRPGGRGGGGPSDNRDNRENRDNRDNRSRADDDSNWRR